jgi:hypothetical protein
VRKGVNVDAAVYVPRVRGVVGAPYHIIRNMQTGPLAE